VLWAQPLWEQFFGPGRGNISRVVIAGTTGGDDFAPSPNASTGLSVGVRILGAVLALPPWWGRQGFDSSIPGSTWIENASGRTLSAPGLVPLWAAVLGLVVLVVLVALGWRRVVRAGSSQLHAGFQTLAVATAVAAVTVVITPIDVLGLSPHKVRWLWVVGAFATYLLVMAVLVGLAAATRRRALAGVAGVGVLALVLAVPTYVNESGPVQFRETYDSISDLRRQLDAYLEGSDAPRAVNFDAGGIAFAEPYTVPVMAELLANGVDVAVTDATLARQLGPERFLDPTSDEAERPVVFVRAGADAATLPAGTERIAFHDGDRSPFSLDNVTDRAVAVFVVRDPVLFSTGAD
jgi:hypothetical protein